MTTLADLMKNELPTTISSTQTSLISAQESARIIDTVLRALTRIPFVQRPVQPARAAAYRPGVVSDSLDGLPGSFITMGDSLTEASENMQTMQTDVTLIATNIDTIQASLKAQTVVSQYRTVVADLQEKLEGTAERVPGTINRAAGADLCLRMVGLTQIGLLFQGMEMLGYVLV